MTEPVRVGDGRFRPAFVVLLVLGAFALAATGCGEEDDAPGTARKPLTIGFIYVGQTDDQGYNEAAHEGALAVARAFPDARILQQEDVPETREAIAALQAQIDQGATILFPTSFGHLDAALEVAAHNPHVTILHLGGLQTAANVGTYFGKNWEAQYAVGQAAGLATRSDRLGFVAAYPIAQSLLAINAFQLGARSVNPRARTHVEFTQSWCAPARQRRATRALLRRRADVIAQHQDCPRAVIETAAAAGAKVTGFHHDARDIAPEAWLTGVRWNWGPLFVDMVRTVRDGRFATSRYASRLRVGVREGTVRLARFGRSATPEIRRTVLATVARLRNGSLQPFAGPVRDQQGRIRIRVPEPTVTELEETDYLVRGVVGVLP